MKTIQLCFLWHMHQPYYTDPLTGSASMPWVRLHATKAYFDMAFLLEQFPEARSTFNFTPSLLLQLEEFSAGRVRDLFLEHAQRPAADLTPTEKAFLIRHFFSANWATMVRPFPRYQELLVKRGIDVHGQDLERLARQFSLQEFLESGFDTFAGMSHQTRGVETFLSVIEEREAELIDLLFDGTPVTCVTKLDAILGQAR